MKYEYKVVYHHTSRDYFREQSAQELTDFINSWANAGWELLQMTLRGEYADNVLLTFRRPL